MYNFRRHYINQVDEADCGVAALAMILHNYGSKISLATLRKFTKTCSPEIPSAQIPPYGRMVYTYPEKELRTYPGTLRGTPEWEAPRIKYGQP